MTWNSLNHHLPHLRELTSTVADRFRTRSDAVAFVTPANQPGFAPHYDATDVFVIQTYGTKEWRVWIPPTDFALPDSPRIDTAGLGEPAIHTVLEPGDVLYIPRGMPHVAVALASLSLHLSVIFRPPTWRDSLETLINQTIKGVPHTEVVDAVTPPDIDIARWRQQMSEVVDTFYKELLSQVEIATPDTTADPEQRVGATMRDRFATFKLVDEVGTETYVRLGSKLDRAVLSSDPDESDIPSAYVAGNAYKISAGLMAAIKRVDAAGQATVAEAFLLDGSPSEAGESAVTACRRLLHLGILEVAS